MLKVSKLIVFPLFHYSLNLQVPDVEAVIIPVGGAGLIAGCAVALKTLKPSVRVIVRFMLTPLR
jgi:hypothetical protein